jgi:drug/metabolite transporter, DME family
VDETGEPAVRARAPLTRASSTRAPLVGAALVFCAASLWATFGLFAKVLYDAGFEPLELASVRAAIGFTGVALFALARLPLTRRAQRRRRDLNRHGRGEHRCRTDPGDHGVHVPIRSLPFYAAYGILGFALFEYVFFAALERTTVSIAVSLLYTAPAFVVVSSALLWRERIGAHRWIALGLVLSGVLLVTGAAGAMLHGTAPLPPAALLLGLGAGAGYALYTLFSKVATERDGPLASLFWSFGFATLALAAVASPVAPFVRAPQHTLLLLALGVVPTILPYAFYLTALRRLRASTASMLASLEPVVAAILAALLLGERMRGVQPLGMALVVTAAVLLARDAARGMES